MGKIVKVMFNTTFPEKSNYEWRVLLGDKELPANFVKIECPSYTTSEHIEGHGLKHHISANPDVIEYIEDGDKISIILK